MMKQSRRSWQAHSLLCGCDVTYGISAAVGRMLQVTAAEMADLEAAK